MADMIQQQGWIGHLEKWDVNCRLANLWTDNEFGKTELFFIASHQTGDKASCNFASTLLTLFVQLFAMLMSQKQTDKLSPRCSLQKCT